MYRVYQAGVIHHMYMYISCVFFHTFLFFSSFSLCFFDPDKIIRFYWNIIHTFTLTFTCDCTFTLTYFSFLTSTRSTSIRSTWYCLRSPLSSPAMSKTTNKTSKTIQRWTSSRRKWSWLLATHLRFRYPMLWRLLGPFAKVTQSKIGRWCPCGTNW